MSLDNVLLVASIARENPALLFIGLTFSVLFMGLAANYVARLIERYPLAQLRRPRRHPVGRRAT